MSKNGYGGEIKLFIVEEIEIYREIYKSVFPMWDRVRLLDVRGNQDIQQVRRDLQVSRPDVLLLGVRKLDSLIIAELEEIREAAPEVSIVVLLTVYDVESMKVMKRLVSRGRAGMAVFLKQSVERLDQLYGVVESVSSGSVILDPALTSLLLADKQERPFFKEFTRRELELLSLLSRGYTNSAIAEALCIDIRTVQRHINNMYSKLRADANFKQRHLRVSAARFYLENTGELQTSEAEQPAESVGVSSR